LSQKLRVTSSNISELGSRFFNETGFQRLSLEVQIQILVFLEFGFSWLERGVLWNSLRNQRLSLREFRLGVILSRAGIFLITDKAESLAGALGARNSADPSEDAGQFFLGNALLSRGLVGRDPK
jgi:hypothetical protein